MRIYVRNYWSTIFSNRLSMKLKFLTNNYIVLLNEFEFYYRWQLITLPKGFISNGWSIPRLLWVLSHPFLYPFLIAYLIHDFMYSNKYPYEITRKECDRFFLHNISLHNKGIWLIFYLWVKYWWAKNFKRDLPFNKKEIKKFRISNKYNSWQDNI